MISKYDKEKAIKSEPTYKLVECLKYYYNIWRSEEDNGVLETSDEVKENFSTAVELCNDEQFAFIRKVISIMTENNGVIKDLPVGFWRFHFNKFVYLFFWEDEFYLVMPDELTAIYKEKLNNKNFREFNLFNQEMAVYARALLNLYGAYEVEQFLLVWNTHHENKIDFVMAKWFLEDLCSFHSDYYMDNNWVIHDCLFEDDFDELFEAVAGIEYYMPPKSVIKVYGEYGFEYDEKIPEIKKLCEFLAEYISDERKLGDCQLDISYSLYHIKSPAQIREYLKGCEFPLDNGEAVSKFECLYQTARYNSHIWDFRGFKPYQYEKIAGKNFKRFVLPKKDKDKKGKKKS